jgi:hypothetical protein
MGRVRRTLGTPQRVPEQAGYPAAGWVTADGPFSAAYYAEARRSSYHGAIRRPAT